MNMELTITTYDTMANYRTRERIDVAAGADPFERASGWCRHLQEMALVQKEICGYKVELVCNGITIMEQEMNWNLPPAAIREGVRGV